MVSKTKKRQSRRLNQNISFDFNLEEPNVETTLSKRTRENRDAQKNVSPEDEIQSMVKNAVARALNDYGIDLNDQPKQSQTAQSNSKTNRNDDNLNTGQNCNNNRYLNRSRDGNCVEPSNMIGGPAANSHTV